MRSSILEYAASGRPVWGTCAGMILLASKLIENRPTPLGLMDITVQRNAFGRQVDSFETELRIKGLEGNLFPAVFIRAPAVLEVGPDVEVLSQIDERQAVAVRQQNMLATAFHPELTHDDRLHKYFLEMVSSRPEK